MKKAVSLTISILWIISLFGCTNMNNTAPVDLAGYINQPISNIESAVDKIYDVGATDGTELTNGAVRVYAMFGSDNISSITISAQSNYSLYGVAVGMDIDEADAIAFNACITQTQDSDTYKSYEMEDGSYLYIYSQDENMVTEVSVEKYNEEPYVGGYVNFDGDYYDYDYDDGYYYDLTDIGFYDMMGYEDWCKLQSIHYTDGEGYVDISTNHGKYSFVNGYCMIYKFNSGTMDYNEAYTRIFRCDIVDNNNAVLVPQDSGNYEKKNIQILERHTFNHDECVYMTINDGSSKGPWIPYGFIDWSSGRKVEGDSGTVYRFDIL